MMPPNEITMDQFIKITKNLLELTRDSTYYIKRVTKTSYKLKPKFINGSIKQSIDDDKLIIMIGDDIPLEDHWLITQILNTVKRDKRYLKYIPYIRGVDDGCGDQNVIYFRFRDKYNISKYLPVLY